MSNYSSVNVVEKVEKLVTPILKDMALELVDIEYMQDGGYWYLRIFIERENGEISLGDCATLSNKIDEDVDKLIEEKFFLEVSSPGVERPLKKIEDFIRFTGENIRVSLKHKLEDKKNFDGVLKAVKDDNIILETNEKELEIPLKEIRKANIIFNFSDLG
ncbi:MAG: ribosome maturation factor RimP [Fusobacteriaceae bacterium]